MGTVTWGIVRGLCIGLIIYGLQYLKILHGLNLMFDLTVGVILCVFFSVLFDRDYGKEEDKKKDAP